MNLLMTGGTGFLGRAFASFNTLPLTRLVVYSRDEAKHAEMRATHNSDIMRWMIGDVRDVDRLARAMRGVDVVVHAAALKRIETAVWNPDEFIKTNIIGTMNVIEAAIQSGVEKVVFISSDKAYQPVSVYGQSKALAESLILNANNITGKDATQFRVVRYGNVANSTGSVIPTWRRILKTLDSVPVTDPACTRFYMTAQQAVDLICNVITGQIDDLTAIPDLPAYRLADLAEAMGANMLIAGLPNHEKMHESMDESRCSKDAPRMSVAEIRKAIEEL